MKSIFTAKRTEEDILALSPHLSIRHSKQAKRMALRVDNCARTMNLVVPEKMSLDKAWRFAFEHKDWINAKIGEIPPPIVFEHGAILPLFGRDRALHISSRASLKMARISLDDNRLIVPINNHETAPRIVRFLKKEAKKTIGHLAITKAKKINKPIKSIQIRDTKSRWGSCGSKGQISFSWRLVFAPWASLDYVVAHEIAHLSHLNHGKEFWTLCDDLSENYAIGKVWMRNYGHSLMRYG